MDKPSEMIELVEIEIKSKPADLITLKNSVGWQDIERFLKDQLNATHVQLEEEEDECFLRRAQGIALAVRRILAMPDELLEKLKELESEKRKELEL